MNSYFKKMMIAATASCLLFVFTGCQVKSAKQLIKQAKRQHGKCEVISQTEGKDWTTVVLKDELQGFEYTVSSKMDSISIDGSSFGSLEGTSDGFAGALTDYVYSATEEDRKKICETYHVSFDYDGRGDLYIDSEEELENGIKALEEIGTALNQYNLEHRMDGWELYLSYSDVYVHQYYETKKAEYGKETEEYLLSPAEEGTLCHIGSIRLPECTFRDREKEQEDYYLEMAQRYDKDAVFLRKEEKTFKDVGIGINNVERTYYQYFPEQDSDPVTFYYFSANGKEFFICNFLDTRTGTWYTSFESSK